jgi:hypothetical protein
MGAFGPTGSRYADMEGFEDIEDAVGGIELGRVFFIERGLFFVYLGSISSISSQLPLKGCMGASGLDFEVTIRSRQPTTATP